MHNNPPCPTLIIKASPTGKLLFCPIHAFPHFFPPSLDRVRN